MSRSTPSPLIITKWVRLRIYAVGVLLTLCFVGVGVKAYGLQVGESERFRDLAERQHLRSIEVPAPRGSIYDRNGLELAGNADVDSIFANPRSITDLATTCEKLSQVLNMDIRTLENRLASRRYFAWIKRHVTPAEAEAIRKLALPGVSLTREPRRFYPGKSLAGQVLGFAGIDGEGLDGLELAMNEVLSGTRAKVSTLRDASGELMVDDPRSQPKAGASITLTLDRSIQFATERALKEAVEVNKAKSATAVVVDVRNGDVLAIASYPDFDPNSPHIGREKGARNRAITDSYEVGSVMKVFTVAGALESGVISPSTVIDTEKGRYRMGRKVFRDSFHDEELDIGGVIKRSSNVGAVKIAQMLGPHALHDTFVDFGFGASTDIELPGEVGGVLRDPRKKRWGELGLATHSFGYGMTSTPLQVTAAMAAIGNEGIYFPPRIIKAVHSGEGAELYERKAQGRRVLSARTAKQLHPMLESVFEYGKQHGTARGLYVPGYRVGGKTGTAHKLDPTTGKYGDHLYLSSFSGLAPIDDPRIAVTVLVDEPHGEEHYGGRVAGPAWTRIVTESLPVLGIQGDPELLVEQQAARRKHDRRMAWRQGIDFDKIERLKKKSEVALSVDEEDQAEDGEAGSTIPLESATASSAPVLSDDEHSDQVFIPDFTGMGVARAIRVAREAGIEIEISGSGQCVDQNLGPGMVSDPGSVRVLFSSDVHSLAVN